MKKILGFFLVAFVGISTTAFAAPFTYTFTGTITSIDDDAGAANTAGIALGDSVSYTFLIDRAREGRETRNAGSYNLLADNGAYDTFFADLLSGSVIDEVNGGFYNNPGDIAEYNSGSERLNDGYHTFFGGSDNNTINLEFFNLGVGSSAMVTEYAFNNAGLFTTVISNDLSLTGVSPVPVPAAVWLFGSGLLGLIGLNYRKNKA
ncbi:MAG: hypothetical protein AB2637_14380 [Candidatus Thiodiazotropha sp.]